MDWMITNISLEIFSIAILLILITCQLVGKEYRGRQDKIFLLALCLHTVLLVLDIATWIIDGKSGLFFYYLNWITNLLVYSFSFIVINVFMLYIWEGIPLSQLTRHIVVGIPVLVTAIFIILLLISLFNGSIFYIDQDNWYHLGPMYKAGTISDIFYMEIIFVVLLYRKKISRRNTVIFLLYAVSLMIVTTLNIIGMEHLNIVLMYSFMTLALLTVFVNIHVQWEKLIKEQELKLRDHQIAIMLSQIQPHFLNNALTSIGKMCELDAGKARVAIVTFAKYLRSNMKSLTLNMIDFSEELKHVKHYLWLEEMRFGDRVKVEWDVNAVGFMIPTLTLQPIVENAVRHGITLKSGGGTILISVVEADDAYVIVISDDGVGFEVENRADDGSAHIGISNVRDRLSILCGGHLVIKSIPGEGTTAVIEIPKGDR